MTYQRPAWTTPEFRDERGAVIDYGHRWGWESPPDDSYSRETNPERFDPLIRVAGALVEFLSAGYDVTATSVGVGRS